MGWDTDSGGRVRHNGIWFTYTAGQLLLPSGYGIAVMANTGMAFSDASAIADALVAIAEGEAPDAVSPIPPSLPRDALFLLATLVTFGLGGWAVRRSRHWAARRAGRPLWRAVARLLPYTAPIAMCLAMTDAFNWIQLAYLYPGYPVWLVSAALVCATLIVTRALRLLKKGQLRRGQLKRGHAEGEPAEEGTADGASAGQPSR